MRVLLLWLCTKIEMPPTGVGGYFKPTYKRAITGSIPPTAVGGGFRSNVARDCKLVSIFLCLLQALSVEVGLEPSTDYRRRYYISNSGDLVGRT